MSHLEVLKNPNKELRETSRVLSVVEILSEKYQTLADNMIQTTKEENGVGLAAPQIGEHVRLIICDTGKELVPFFNPIITDFSTKLMVSEEGCLSIPGVFGLVNRHRTVKVEALTRDGEKIKLTAGGLISTIFQHEIDHLDGILFIDRATILKDAKTGKRIEI